MHALIVVQTAIDSQEAAQKIADTVVSKRLAACGWVSGPINGTYWWQGKLEHAQEWVCSFKTRQALYGALEQTIRELHSYEVPEIIATPIVAGDQRYLDWIVDETSNDEP